jgi:hypothetical protein
MLMRIVTIVAAFALLAAFPALGGERLRIRVSPEMSFAPANLVVQAMIESDDDNRSLEVVAESSDFYRSSEISLDGHRAPHLNVFELRSLPSGDYEVRAVLKGAGNQTRAVTRQLVRVISERDGS